MNRNILTINGHQAVIEYDPEREQFRGEFRGLNGGADFYGTSLKTLKTEGAKSLKVFLEMCAERGITPQKEFSGKFNLRVTPEVHETVSRRAAAEGKSLNQFVADVLSELAD
jgi:predicted HicB family RNase H-like nuclease